MTENDLDREITEIERYAIGKWLSSGDALVCGRCGGVYIPSRSSDDRLCGMCVPLRGLKLGDKSPQYAKCEYCGEPIRGKRNDSKYCEDSCRVLAYRRRRDGDSGTTRESAVLGKDGQESAPTLSVNRLSGKGASTA